MVFSQYEFFTFEFCLEVDHLSTTTNLRVEKRFVTFRDSPVYEIFFTSMAASTT